MHDHSTKIAGTLGFVYATVSAFNLDSALSTIINTAIGFVVSRILMWLADQVKAATEGRISFSITNIFRHKFSTMMGIVCALFLSFLLVSGHIDWQQYILAMAATAGPLLGFGSGNTPGESPATPSTPILRP